METRESTIYTHIKYLEEEIKIRIESLKINLDELFEQFKTHLAQIKKEMIK